VIKAALGDRLDAWIRAALPFLFRRPVNPNGLTVAGTLVSFAAAAAFALGEFAWGGVLMLAGGFFDLIDGVVARHHGVTSRFGAFLDATLDRVTDMAILLGITMYYAIAGEPGRVLLAGYALASGVLVSYVKARAELEVSDFRVGLLERGERVGVIAAGAIFGFMVVALWIVAVGSTITVIQRFALAYREMERRDASERVGEHT
jgi:CDP-diacylglycerol--glycerol-3-phosphate 3-phosphatidyltransferase